jgi:hypothetical protein
MVVRRFSIVPFAQTGFSCFLCLAYQWFADDFDLCVALALNFWARSNFAWLFECM